MKKSEELKKKLSYRRKFLWQDFKEETAQAFDFCEPYKTFLDTCKTERECIRYITEELKTVSYTHLTLPTN